MATAGIYGRVLDLVDANLFAGLGLATSSVTTASYTSSQTVAAAPRVQVTLSGSGLTYDSAGQLSGGTITSVRLEVTLPDGVRSTGAFDQVEQPATALGSMLSRADAPGFLETLMAGDDRVDGSGVLKGYAGADVIMSTGPDDTVLAGAGNDRITVVGFGASGTYLRGETGDDYVSGSFGFDDINGNEGLDTLNGGAGDDWVVGGKDNDFASGETGDDIVYGNLGNDTVHGGDGRDIVRGGQGNDSVAGAAGDDFVSGDRGDDTVAGGAGADLFHGSQDIGLDRIVDFRTSEGDRVLLDAGTTYMLRQQGADVMVDMGGGHMMVLVEVQLSSLPADWIFLGG